MNQELALNLFQYKDGKLFWKVNPGPWRNVIGKEAGCEDISPRTNYRNIIYNYKKYKTHRIIYMMHYGEIPEGLQIDHLNQNRMDNRIENLRATTHGENQRNRDCFKGWTYRKDNSKWRARIMLAGKAVNIGHYGTECAAKLAYLMRKLQWNLAHKTA